MSRALRRAIPAAAAILLAVMFAALGAWQVQRLAWKTDLIARVDVRVHAPPAAAPGPGAWPTLSRQGDEYRRVRLSGQFLDGRDTLVQAVTELGGGYWVMTPLRTDQGFIVLVNRGFIPAERKTMANGASGDERAVVGLLRISEPRGGFLRANDPAGDRWRSRDVAAIGARRGLAPTAPYFVDAEAAPGDGSWPRGGLTVVRFHNSHLVYAVTWFALALGSVWGAVMILRRRPAA